MTKKYIVKSFSLILLPFLLLVMISTQSQSQPAGGYGSIVGLQAGQVTINWGSNDGVREGAGFLAFRKSQMVHPETGEYLSVERDIIGRIEISKVYPAYSVGRFASTQKNPQIGDLVEPILDSKRQYPYQDTQVSKGTIINRTGTTVTFTLGIVDGIEKGLYFDVFRGNEKVGTLEVNRVSDQTSMAAIMSGTETIQVGDRVELADQQQADRTVYRMGYQQQPFYSRPYAPSLPPGQTSSSLLTQVEQPSLFATISSIDKNKIKFKWLNRKRPAKTGIVAGIYREEQLTHPISGQNLGSPAVLIGQVRVDAAKRKDGTGTIVSLEVAPRKGDKVGYIWSPATLAYSTQQSLPQPNRWDSRNPQQTAAGLNQEVLSIQNDLVFLRSMRTRLETIERSMNSQQRLTRSLQRDMRLIKEQLGITKGTVPAGERMIPAQSPEEVFGSHPEKSKIYSFKVANDFKVKLQVRDKTVLVSLDKDSVHVTETKSSMTESAPSAAETAEKTTSEQDTSQKGESLAHNDSGASSPLIDYDKLITPEEAPPVPFYQAHLKMIAGGAGALLVLVILALLKKKKKPAKKKKAAEEDEGEEELNEEELEEENVEDV